MKSSNACPRCFRLRCVRGFSRHGPQSRCRFCPATTKSSADIILDPHLGGLKEGDGYIDPAVIPARVEDQCGELPENPKSSEGEWATSWVKAAHDPRRSLAHAAPSHARRASDRKQLDALSSFCRLPRRVAARFPQTIHAGPWIFTPS